MSGRKLVIVPKSKAEWDDARCDARVERVVEEIWPKYNAVWDALEVVLNRFAPEPQPLTYERFLVRYNLKDWFLGEMMAKRVVE